MNNPLPVPTKHASHIEHKERVELQPELKDEDLLALDEIMSKHIRRVLDITGGRVGGEKG